MRRLRFVDGRLLHQAAQLLGAAATARETAQMPVTPAEQGGIDRITAAARTELGDHTFAAAFDHGRKRRPDDVPGMVSPSANPPPHHAQP